MYENPNGNATLVKDYWVTEKYTRSACYCIQDRIVNMTNTPWKVATKDATERGRCEEARCAVMPERSVLISAMFLAALFACETLPFIAVNIGGFVIAYTFV